MADNECRLNFLQSILKRQKICSPIKDLGGMDIWNKKID